MASNFGRWEKDPFFSAAEEVQESADRMESTYRTWMHAVKDTSSMWNSDELRRDLHTALGTTKWQLEEFERAVKLSYANTSAEDARDRHHQFIIAIRNQISMIEISLKESTFSEGKTSVPWVRLDEGECNELALFLSGPSTNGEEAQLKTHFVDDETSGLKVTSTESLPNCSKSGLLESEEKLYGHRRTASASADMDVWTISMPDIDFQQRSNSGQAELLPRKIPSFSGLLKSMESASKMKWLKNGFRKWRIVDSKQESDTFSSRSQQLSRGINGCYDRSKSCLDSCDDCYDKQLYGWYGAIQRQLQRSQYQMQYSRPIQVTIWICLLLCLIVLFAYCSI